MTDVYIIRHCEALGNSLRIFQGVSDCDITPCGKAQLELLSERFKSIHFDKIYSSPLKRAILTAQAANKYLQLPIEIKKDLIEIDGGEIEGISWVDFPETRPLLEYNWNMEPHNFHPKGGEPMTSVYERANKVMKEIVNENKGKTVVIASHGCTIRNIMCGAMGKPIEQLNSVEWADNTGVTILRYNGDNLPKILMFNDVSHLTEEYLPKKHRINKIYCVKPED